MLSSLPAHPGLEPGYKAVNCLQSLSTEQRFSADGAGIVSFVVQILGVSLSFEMQFDGGCPLFLHQCHHILLVLRLISDPDALRELSGLPHSVCFGFNSESLVQWC